MINLNQGYLEYKQKIHAERKRNEHLYDDIIIVYVTFLSMETKNLVHNIICNGVIDIRLRKLYEQRELKKKKEQTRSNMFSSLFGKLNPALKSGPNKIELGELPPEKKNDSAPIKLALSNLKISS